MIIYRQSKLSMMNVVCISSMAAIKKFFIFKIYVPEELNKKGFVSWNDPQKGRQRKYGNINSFKTYEERITAAEALKNELKKGYLKSRHIIEALEFCEKRKLFWKKKTYQTNKSKVDVFAKWLNGKEVTPQRAEAFINHLVKTRSKTTAESYRSKLLHIFEKMGSAHLFNHIEKINYSTTPAKYFQKHQIKKLKTFLLEHDPDLWFAAQIEYYCFIRPGNEMHHLRVSDVDFDTWRICIRNEHAKNKRQEYVTIPNAFRSDIYSQLKDREARHYIFPSKKDITKPRGDNYFSYKFRIYANKLGFGKEHKFYSFKHTGAMACALAGVSIKELQIQLRHKDLETTDKYLRQLGVQDLHRLAERFPAI